MHITCKRRRVLCILVKFFCYKNNGLVPSKIFIYLRSKWYNILSNGFFECFVEHNFLIYKSCFRMKTEERILVSSDGPDVNVVKLKPPMVFTRANADQFLKSFKTMIADIRTQRFQLLWFFLYCYPLNVYKSWYT